jgi:ADP-ribose pyrophosphatase YjhB (NUDIX family)
MRRKYPAQPIVGVGAVIFRDDGAVLLVKRDREPGKGRWSLPGGAVELGETLMEALKREVREEASIGVEIRGVVKLVDRIIHDPGGRVRFHYVIIDYWGLIISVSVQASSDASDACFFPIQGLKGSGIDDDVLETVLMAECLRSKSGPRAEGLV